MVSKYEVLKALIYTRRSCPLKVKEIAQFLRAKPGILSVQLYRLSKEDLVFRKGIRKGWYISKQGKERSKMLDKLGITTSPLEEKSPEDKLAEELDMEIRRAQTTNYGKFLEIGKLVGVAPGFVLLTADYLFGIGDYSDPRIVWKALCDMGISRDLARVWFYRWCSFLGKRVPRELTEDVEGYHS